MDDEKLREETLFLAVTRPTMWLGVPIEASLPIALAACLTLIISGNPLYAFALAGAFLAIARLIVRHDANAFRLLWLWTTTKARCAHTKHPPPERPAPSRHPPSRSSAERAR